ncbi:hypothetical protein PG2003B_1138 [Bifidobacterium pseudolongum subsp. globosum]|uniref:Terminase small subunit n=2 Tax=Bifidobacterium pseudolongum TaxID=1694 RepID=A0A4V1Y4N5_9BIFI|nr:hypothetical protein PG2003B_1138 [Bifidobacterium pseudolongum subsp. globosum]
MKCCVCGKEYETSRRGRPSKYCSKNCAKRAERMRKKIGARPAATKKERLAPLSADRHAFEAQMEREMDEPLEKTLRRLRARLRQVIDDPATPPTALAGLSKELVSVSNQLMQITGANAAIDLFADDSEDEEANDDVDVGAEII